MGFKWFSDTPSSIRTPDPVDPKPDKFSIEHIEEHGDFVVALVNYPNCTTFKGQKVIVWEGVTKDEVMRMSLIDPHFLDSNKIIARFRPTVKGWKYAMKFVTI